MFNKICIYDYNTLVEPHQLDWIQAFSKEKVPQLNLNQLRQLDAQQLSEIDGLLVSISTVVNSEFTSLLPNLKYIGILGSKMTSVDLKLCATRSPMPITVKNVHSYCDFETAEFVMFQILLFARDHNKLAWKNGPTTLKGKTLGIVGAGKVGWELAKLGQAFSMNIIYHSRNRKSQFDQKGFAFESENDLIKNSDIISIHVPHNTLVMGSEELNLIKPNSLVFNTCGGKIFCKDSFLKHIESSESIFIFDIAGSTFLEGQEPIRNTLQLPCLAYKTLESQDNLIKQSASNIQEFLGKETR